MSLYNDGGVLSDGTIFHFKELADGSPTGTFTEVPAIELDPDQPEMGIVKLKKPLNNTSKWIDKAPGFIDAKKWKGQLKYNAAFEGIYQQLWDFRNDRTPLYWEILFPDAVTDADKSFIGCKGYITVLGVPPAKMSDEAPEELIVPFEIELFGEMAYSSLDDPTP